MELSGGRGDILRLCSLFSLVQLLYYCALIGRELRSDATPAFLCPKEPAQGTQSPLLGAFR